MRLFISTVPTSWNLQTTLLQHQPKPQWSSSFFLQHMLPMLGNHQKLLTAQLLWVGATRRFWLQLVCLSSLCTWAQTCHRCTANAEDASRQTIADVKFSLAGRTRSSHASLVLNCPTESTRYLRPAVQAVTSLSQVCSWWVRLPSYVGLWTPPHSHCQHKHVMAALSWASPSHGRIWFRILSEGRRVGFGVDSVR